MEFSEGSSSEILERLSTAYGVETQKELAEKLGVSAANVSNWVQRKSVPGSALVRCALDTSCDLSWLATGRFSKAKPIPSSLQPRHEQKNLVGKDLIRQMLATGGKEVLQRILKAYGFSTQKELSEYFDISTGTISTWVRRDYFPGDLVIACALDTGHSLKWLSTGKLTESPFCQQQESPSVMKIEKIRLNCGKFIDEGFVLIDKNLLGFDEEGDNFIYIELANEKWFFKKQAEVLHNGIWLIDIDGLIDIYNVMRQPDGFLNLTGEYGSLVCNASKLKTVGFAVNKCVNLSSQDR